MTSSQKIPFGDFRSLNLPEAHREIIESGFQAVNSVDGAWSILKRPDVPGTRPCGYCGEVIERRPTCQICGGAGTVECSFMVDAEHHSDPLVAETIKKINAAISNRFSGHSGSSYGFTIRVLERIAKDGWDAYANKILLKYGPPKPETMEEKRKRFLALPTNMTPVEQAKAIEEFQDVPMSYAELRARFG